MLMFTIMCPVVCLVLECLVFCFNKIKASNKQKISNSNRFNITIGNNEMALPVCEHISYDLSEYGKVSSLTKLNVACFNYQSKPLVKQNKKLDKIIKICNYIIIASAIAFFIFFYILMVS